MYLVSSSSIRSALLWCYIYSHCGPKMNNDLIGGKSSFHGSDLSYKQEKEIYLVLSPRR